MAAKAYDRLRVEWVILGHRYRYTSEEDLQVGLAKAFEEAGLSFEREVRLSKADRIDFIVGEGIGVEVKIKDRMSALQRQLQRYSASPRITALFVITPRLQLCRMPSAMSGKPVKTILIPGGFP